VVKLIFNNVEDLDKKQKT